MRLLTACLALTLTGVVAQSVPAAAGDLGNDAPGGIKDYGYGGTPVPAPVPYEETYKWYLRGDVGTLFKGQGKIANDGMPVNTISPSDWTEQSIVSFGFGRYLTPSLRTEFTVDYASQRPISGKNPSTADITITRSNATEKDVTLYHGLQNDDITYQNSTFLMSAFYDLHKFGPINPYIGAGIGIARHQLNRSGTEAYTCDPLVSTTTPLPVGVAAPGCGPLNPASLTAVSNGQTTAYGLAAQLSAGVSYDLSARTHWDTGYRMLWQGGRAAVASSNGINSVRLDSHIEHQLRTGVRWDLW